MAFMSIIEEWQELNKMLLSVSEMLCGRLMVKSRLDSSAKISYVFVFKATRTLSGITILYDHGLSEQAQALGRVCKVYSTPNQRMVAAISHMAG